MEHKRQSVHPEIVGDALTGADLLARAQAINPLVTERTVEFWRQERLLPKPSRTGQSGRRPIWTYPEGTEQQLEALLAYRSRRRDINLVRLGLWVSGFSIPMSDVRAAMIAELESYQRTFDKLVAAENFSEPAMCREAALKKLARYLAGKRSKLPRGGRQPLAERERAFLFLVRLFFGDPNSGDTFAEDARALERAIGLDRARRPVSERVGAWLDGPAEVVAVVGQIASIPRLLEVARSASDEELQNSLQLMKVVVSGLGMFSALADAMAGSANAAGIAFLREMDGSDDPLMGLLALMFVAFIRTDDLRDGLLKLLQTLGDMNKLREGLVGFRALPQDERFDRLARVSPEEREWVDRLLADELPSAHRRRSVRSPRNLHAGGSGQ